LEIGDWVLAFGSPFGLHRTVTQGIISAKARGLNDPRMKQELLQTDAAINPGNSGGPLVNLRGEVIGVNTAISTSSGGYDGVGFAVPASLAKWVAEQLEEHGKVQRAYLGVMAQDIDSGLAESLGQDTPHGALVAELTRGAPAEKAGLRVQDIVTELNGQQITNTRKLMSVAEKLNVGQKYTLVFLRNGKPQAIEVTMAELPERLVAQESETTESETSGDGTSIDELGLTVRPVSPELAEQLKLDEVRGVVITSVKPDSYAASLGIQVGDVIFRMGSVDVNSDADVQKGVEEARENRRILLYIKTATGTRFISVPLVTQP
jgi:serine protease Do